MTPDRNSRVLIADDQPDVLEALRLLLKGEAFEVETATSPAGVLAAGAVFTSLGGSYPAVGGAAAARGVLTMENLGRDWREARALGLPAAAVTVFHRQGAGAYGHNTADDAAFEVLHDLNLGCGNDAALRRRDFLQTCKHGPQNKDRNQTDERLHQQVKTARGRCQKISADGRWHARGGQYVGRGGCRFAHDGLPRAFISEP